MTSNSLAPQGSCCMGGKVGRGETRKVGRREREGWEGETGQVGKERDGKVGKVRGKVG